MHCADPANTPFLNSLTNRSVAHNPPTFTGSVVMFCPLLGNVIVAALLGGSAGILAWKPVDCEFGLTSACELFAGARVNNERNKIFTIASKTIFLFLITIRMIIANS